MHFFQLTEDTEDTEGKQQLEFETDVEVKIQSKISTWLKFLRLIITTAHE
jgi:hypothetical protein